MAGWNVVFTPLISGKPWTGSTIYEEPLGGSEAAVAYLAREFARRGHTVSVYTHGQPGTFEGVTYKPVQDLNEGPPKCDIHISSRWLDVLQVSRGAVRVLWLHDLPQAPARELPANMVVAVSRFQATRWGLPVDTPEVAIIGDGVDTTLFVGKEVRDMNRLLWVSNPDRGLYIASELFVKEVLPRWPDLRLHVYGRSSVYGWGPEAERYYLPPKEYVQAGLVVLHDPLPRLRLARELMKSWAVWYPTHWAETFCMAALEAQAAGTPVLATPIGALNETVKGGIIGWDMVNAVSQLRNKNRWKKLSEAGIEQASRFSWSAIASQWEGAIARIAEGGHLL